MKPLPRATCTDKPRRSKRKKGGGTLGARVELRCESAERDAWVKAAALAGYLSLSDWLRDVANGAARRAPLLSSASEHWCSPRMIVDRVRKIRGAIGLDPCSNAGSIVGAIVAWILARDGDSLARSWAGFGLVYVNPPFGRAIAAWAAKLAREAAAGVEIVGLVPARLETEWWATIREHFDVVVLDRRIAFIDPETGEEGDQAPFPVAMIYAGPDPEAFRAAFGDVEAEYLPRRQLALFAEAAE